MQFKQYVEPLKTYPVALTPTAKYAFLTSDRLRPYVEAGAGIVWTDLADRIPEKGSQFNFNLQTGAGTLRLHASDDLDQPDLSVSASFECRHGSSE